MKKCAVALWLLTLLITGLTACDDSKDPIVDTTRPMSLDSLILLHPDSAELLVKRGWQSVDERDYDAALADAAKAFRLDSNNLDNRLLYAKVLCTRPGRTVEEIYTAQRHYKLLLKKRPKSPEVLVGLAFTYSQFQDFDQSFKYINDALRIDPKFRDAYALKGSNYGALGNRELVKSSYETAIQQDPEYFEAYMLLGAFYQEEKNPVCIQYFITANELQPDNAEALYSMAYAKMNFGQIEEAKIDYRKMTADTSDYYASQAFFQLGYIKSFLEDPKKPDYDSAMYFYNRAITAEPRFPEAYFQLGFCYDQKGDISRALKMLGKSLKYNPEYEPARNFADSLQRLL